MTQDVALLPLYAFMALTGTPLLGMVIIFIYLQNAYTIFMIYYVYIFSLTKFKFYIII